MNKEDIINPLELDAFCEHLQQENKQLKEQLEYIRSGEYINQLRFERDMLQDLVDKQEVSKEDKEFIDCTHRNTELLEINEEHKKINGQLREENKALHKVFNEELDCIKRALDKIDKLQEDIFGLEDKMWIYHELTIISQILKKDDEDV